MKWVIAILEFVKRILGIVSEEEKMRRAASDAIKDIDFDGKKKQEGDYLDTLNKYPNGVRSGKRKRSP